MDFNTIDIEHVQYSRPSIGTNRKYLSEAKYEVEGNFPEEIEILSPHLLAKMPIKTTDRKCYIILRLSKANRDFFTFLTTLEEHSKAAILENTMSWFQKDLPIDVIDDYHNQFVKISSSEDPYIKIQIPHDKDTGEIHIPITTDKGVNVNPTTIYEGTTVKAQMRYVGIKFYKQQFASEWYVTKLIVYDNQEPDDDEDEFDFRDNEDMLSLYSEQPTDHIDRTLPTNIEVKISKVSDDDPTDQSPHAGHEGTTSNELADTKAEDIKVNMVSDTPKPEPEAQPDKAEPGPEPDKAEPKSEPEPEPEPKPEPEPEPQAEPEPKPEPEPQLKQKQRRRRIRMPNGKYKVISR